MWRESRRTWLAQCQVAPIKEREMNFRILGAQNHMDTDTDTDTDTHTPDAHV